MHSDNGLFWLTPPNWPFSYLFYWVTKNTILPTILLIITQGNALLIYSTIHSVSALAFSLSQSCLCPKWRQGTPWSGHQPIAGHRNWHTLAHAHTHIQIHRQFRVIKSLKMYKVGRSPGTWEKATQQRKKLQILHRKAGFKIKSWISNLKTVRQTS